ncbi:hypothetical protein BC937DRAFT_92828, partial [Endogone sp. FLAS-F59071]
HHGLLYKREIGLQRSSITFTLTLSSLNQPQPLPNFAIVNPPNLTQCKTSPSTTTTWLVPSPTKMRPWSSTLSTKMMMPSCLRIPHSLSQHAVPPPARCALNGFQITLPLALAWVFLLANGVWEFSVAALKIPYDINKNMTRISYPFDVHLMIHWVGWDPS